MERFHYAIDVSGTVWSVKVSRTLEMCLIQKKTCALIGTRRVMKIKKKVLLKRYHTLCDEAAF